MTDVVLSALTRAELEREILLYNGFARRLLEAVRANTKAEWKVRREVEDLVRHYEPQLQRHFTRGNQEAIDRLVLERRAERNERRWEGLREPAPSSVRP